MDTKKKIQIGVIVGCMVATGVILFLGMGGGGGSTTNLNEQHLQPGAIGEIPTEDITTTTTPTGTTSNLPIPGLPTVHPVPGVFPQSTAVNGSVFDSSKFRNLQDYTPLTISPEEIGRPNPYQPF